ncbi:uncharacterized protein LOC123271763 [Cotesia glomerata]|uniref:uncharacterized protein LOC123271763 n=1 Tax=Cotesia glomerata TaxID=32391 RepID=UPI001D01C11F|nr:uncharacterized protein LOC123271763 [Cotesia glomerata]
MTKTRKEGLYSPTKLKKALESVKNGRTIRQTAKDFEIPYSTIRSKMKGINPIEMKKGPSPVLSAEEETNLVNWILNLGVAEYPRTKESILDSVQLICTKLKKVTPFTNNRPSKSWYNGFMKRHHDVLSTRTSQKLTKRRVNVNEKSIRLWFEEVGSYLKSKNLLNIDPSRVFNLDENCFYLKPKTEEVIVKKSQKNVYNLCNDDKDSLTALITCNAKGEMPPDLIMFKGAKLPAKIAKLLPKSFVADKSENGWMTSASFYDYIVNIFYPWCLEKNIVFPIILYVDGHSSHLTLSLSEFCAAKKIELISLYPNATHLMHPLNVALLEPLKKSYKNAVMEWREEHNGISLNKENFGHVLSKALSQLDLPKILGKGFEVCGLHPFCADAIDYSKILADNSQESNLEKNEIMQTNDDVDNSFINFVEQNIDNESLERFKNTAKFGGEWNGPLEEKRLYEFWLKTCFVSDGYSQLINYN